MDAEEFARQIDALALEAMEWLQFDALFEKANPMLKMIGQQASTLQLRNLCYNCALRKPDEARRFLGFLWRRIGEIMENDDGSGEDRKTLYPEADGLTPGDGGENPEPDSGAS